MKDLLKSFGYAASGILCSIKQERNMRIHIVVSLYMFCFLLFHDFFEVTRTQFAILFVACACVMMGELINTSVEAAINLIEDKFNEKYNDFAKIAKDTAAGGVLISACFAVAVGINIFWQREAFIKMFAYYKAHLGMLLILILSLVISIAFIFMGPQKILSLFKKKEK